MAVISRSLFHDNSDSSSSNHTCPIPGPDPVQVPVVGKLTFHQFTTIISGAAALFACLVSFYLIFRHATHYAIPKEQKQIIRIIFMIPVFAAVSFLSVAFPESSTYLHPVSALYEALALASFFLLLCAFVDEDDHEREAFFSSTGTQKQHVAATIGAFQFPCVALLLLIVTVITQAVGTFCETSNKIYFAHIWVIILTILSTIVAIMSILRFYKVLKPTINNRKPLSKLLAFKAIVFLSFVQEIVFSFLTSSSHGYISPSPQHGSSDLIAGLPNTVLCLEMAIFSLLFLYIYRTQEYIYRPKTASGASAVPLGHGGYQGGFLGIKAYLQVLNISDIIKGVLSTPRLFMHRKNIVRGSQARPNEYSSIEMAGGEPNEGSSMVPAHYPEHLYNHPPQPYQGRGAYDPSSRGV